MKFFQPKIFLIIVAFWMVSCEEDDQVANESTFSTNGGSALNSSSKTRKNNTSGRDLASEPQAIYDGSVGGPINLNTAQAWVQNFKNTSPADAISSHYFGRNVIDDILAQEGCTGIRIYYALDEAGEKVLIISGVDDIGENMVPLSPTVRKGENILADMSFPCPSVCPRVSL